MQKGWFFTVEIIPISIKTLEFILEFPGTVGTYRIVTKTRKSGKYRNFIGNIGILSEFPDFPYWNSQISHISNIGNIGKIQEFRRNMGNWHKTEKHYFLYEKVNYIGNEDKGLVREHFKFHAFHLYWKNMSGFRQKPYQSWKRVGFEGTDKIVWGRCRSFPCSYFWAYGIPGSNILESVIGSFRCISSFFSSVCSSKRFCRFRKFPITSKILFQYQKSSGKQFFSLKS